MDRFFFNISKNRKAKISNSKQMQMKNQELCIN